MFNKKLIILSLLAIFCIGITITSVSANEDNYNLTEFYGNEISEQPLEENSMGVNYDEKNEISITSDSKIADSSETYKIEINTKNYTNSDNPNKLSFRIGQEKNGIFYGVTYPDVVYTIKDVNNNIVYNQRTSTKSFDSNYEIFKNLPDGKYFCKLNSPQYNGATIDWQVNVDTTSIGLKAKNFMIINKNYEEFDNPEKLIIIPKGTLPSYSIYYKVFDNNNNLKYEYYNYTLKQDIRHYLISNQALFKNFPDGTYTCIFTTSNSLDYEYLLNNANMVWKVTKTSKKNNPIKTTTSNSKNHYTKYIKVGKYKVPVLSDDSKNTQKNKVIKYLKKHVKKGHTFKIHGYKFKVSAKNYRKILYYKKYGYDGKMGAAPFKAKTNKYYTIKKPIYKTKKVTKKVWKYKKVLQSEYWSWDGGSEWQDYNTWEKYVKKGWTWYGTSDKEKTYSDYSYYSAHYYKLKKKVKTTINKKTIVGYKKVKVRVYAWSVESQFKVGVQFRAGGQGHNQPITGYYFF